MPIDRPTARMLRWSFRLLTAALAACDVYDASLLRRLEAGVGDAGSPDASACDAADCAPCDACAEPPRSDAGPHRDASSADAATDATGACATATDVVACLDFESGLDPDWGLEGNVALELDDAATGVRSLAVAPTDGPAVLHVDRVGRYASGRYWFRASVRIERTQAEAAVDVGFLRWAEAEPDRKRLDFVLAEDRTLEVRLSRGDTELTRWRYTRDRYPVDRWMCIEAAMSLGPNGSVRIYLDGVEIGLHGVDSGGTWTDLFVGSALVGAGQGPVRFLVDDAMWTTRRNACPTL